MKHAACAVLALALAATGCSGGAGAGSAARAGEGTLVVGELAEPVSLNPLMLEGTTSGMIGSILYSFLLTNDANGNLAPDVATEVPTLANGGISRDGLRVTYHLRQNVRWHDGVPLTARDCVFTYRA
ncbi:MAG: peptide ABC transporter substrate-binding protein, partial [Candidatus Eremiobacteraeota bacterium]|nr:peptide ABC transporter substrate-binding protein [Candidatus Eremiobacteraeota bacterium]